MKFECKKEELLNALETIAPAINSKAGSPILTNTLMDVQTDKIVFTGTSLDITLITTLKIVTNEVGVLLVPAQKFIAILKALSAEDIINITSKDNKTLIIKCGSSTFKISCMPKEEFPKLSVFKDDNNIGILQQTLKNILKKVSFAMLTDNSRPTLNGMLFDFKKDKFTVVATDAKRIAIAKIKVDNKLEKSFILPMKSVNILEKLFNTTEAVSINVEKGQVSFSGSGTQFVSKLIEGTFPDFEKAIPKEVKDKLIINRKNFISALEKAALFTSSDSTAIKLNINADKIVIAKQTEIDDVQTKLDCKFTKDLIIGFNPNYLLDVLTKVDSDSVEIEIENNDKPALLRKAEDYIYIMLPNKI